MTGKIIAVYEQRVSEECLEAFLTPTHDGRSKTCQNNPNRPWQRPLITPELGWISESHSEVKWSAGCKKFRTGSLQDWNLIGENRVGVFSPPPVVPVVAYRYFRLRSIRRRRLTLLFDPINRDYLIKNISVTLVFHPCHGGGRLIWWQLVPVVRT